MTFGEKLTKIREEKGLSKVALAGRCGLAKRTIYTYEKGTVEPHFSNMEKVASALEVPLESLIDDKYEDPDEYVKRQRFYERVKVKLGYKAVKDAKEFMEDATIHFAGGSLDEDAVKVVMDSLEDVFFDLKQDSHDTFTPHKYKDMAAQRESQSTPPMTRQGTPRQRRTTMLRIQQEAHEKGVKWYDED